MKILIKNARIVAPSQVENGKTRSLLIEDGIIKQIADRIDTETDRVIDIENLHISPGWTDLFSHFCDPGYEYRETLESGAAAAAAGGYTTVLIIPNTKPPLDSRTQIEYVMRRSERLPVTVYPIGAVSKGLEGKDLAEMYDMHVAGARAFSDGIRPVQSAGLLLKALQYIKAFEGIIIQLPDDRSISQFGLVNEGLWSTRLGISGIPDIAELMMIKKDIDLLRYTGSKMHISGLSLAESVQLIREAKAEGIALTCSVTPYHLNLTDEVLQEFDSNYKVNPPIREQGDVETLRRALKEGIIDCLASHHIPQDLDSKDKEFEYSSVGMTGLETAFGLLGNALPDLKVEEKVDILAIRSRRCFGLDIPKIEEGHAAELTFFDPDKKWIFKKENTRSKSRNSPFYNKELTGKPLGIMNKNHLILNA